MKLRVLTGRPVRRSFLVVIALAALAVPTLVDRGEAAIPDSSGVITGCYQLSGGALRVIDTDETPDCRAEEHRLTWNQTGPGMSQYVLTGNIKFVGAGATEELDVLCTSSRKPLGGGVRAQTSLLDTTSQPVVVLGTYPTPTGWKALVKNEGASTVLGVIHVVCAVVP